MKKPVSFAFLCAIVLSLPTAAQNILATDSIFETVDVQPEFPGGYKALGKYVDGKNHKYPKEARMNKIQGTVVVQFIINTDGSCSDFEIVKGIGYGCDEAAIEAFRKMPKWRPHWSMVNPSELNDKWPTATSFEMSYHP